MIDKNILVDGIKGAIKKGLSLIPSSSFLLTDNEKNEKIFVDEMSKILNEKNTKKLVSNIKNLENGQRLWYLGLFMPNHYDHDHDNESSNDSDFGSDFGGGEMGESVEVKKSPSDLIIETLLEGIDLNETLEDNLLDDEKDISDEDGIDIDNDEIIDEKKAKDDVELEDDKVEDANMDNEEETKIIDAANDKFKLDSGDEDTSKNDHIELDSKDDSSTEIPPSDEDTSKGAKIEITKDDEFIYVTFKISKDSKDLEVDGDKMIIKLK